MADQHQILVLRPLSPGDATSTAQLCRLPEIVPEALDIQLTTSHYTALNHTDGNQELHRFKSL